MLNPASMKQALVEGAVKLKDLNQLEQGNGKIDLIASQKILAEYSPRASLSPNALDFTSCPYMWPYCHQPLYAYALPVVYNATIVNGMGVTGRVAKAPEYKGADAAGDLLHVTFTYSDLIWPWSGYLAVHIEVRNVMYGRALG
jgi:membrane-bound transcription factor site-1 protease